MRQSLLEHCKEPWNEGDVKPHTVPTIDAANEMKEKLRHPGSDYRKVR